MRQKRKIAGVLAAIMIASTAMTGFAAADKLEGKDRSLTTEESSAAEEEEDFIEEEKEISSEKESVEGSDEEGDIGTEAEDKEESSEEETLGDDEASKDKEEIEEAEKTEEKEETDKENQETEESEKDDSSDEGKDGKNDNGQTSGENEEETNEEEVEDEDSADMTESDKEDEADENASEEETEEDSEEGAEAKNDLEIIETQKTEANAQKDEYVAEISGESYESLQEAVDTAEIGDTVTLIEDIDISESGLEIGKGKDITLDLNGCTLTSANTEIGNIKVEGKLTLDDSGSGGVITTNTDYKYQAADRGVIYVEGAGSEFIMESGSIETVRDNPESNGQFGVYAGKKSTVIINGGKIESGWYAVSSSGNNKEKSDSSTIEINGGELISTADYAIYHPQEGSLKINDGFICGQAGGISVNRGKLEIAGGTITGEGAGSTGDWGDGTGNQENAALNLEAEYGDVEVKITDGTFNANGDAVIIASGSKFKVDLKISGGTYSAKIDEKYLESGYVCTEQGEGSFIVEEADINNTNDLAEILNIAVTKEYDSLKLNEDTDYVLNEKVTIPEGIKLAVDMNGASADFGSNYIVVKGDLSIENGAFSYDGGITAIELGGTKETGWTKGSRLTLDNVELTVTQQSTAIMVYGEDSELYICGDDTLISSEQWFAIGTNGSKESTLNPTVSITGGTVEATAENAIYLPAWGGKTIISGDETLVKGLYSAVQVCGGSITVDGATLESTWEGKRVQQDQYPDGTINDGAALSYVTREGYAANTEEDNEINITGGKFISRNNPALQIYGYKKSTGDGGAADIQGLEILTVSGGEFITNAHGEQPVQIYTTSMPEKTEITGGAFSSDISVLKPDDKIKHEILKEPYICKQNGDMYYVIEKSSDIDTDVKTEVTVEVKAEDVTIPEGADEASVKNMIETVIGEVKENNSSKADPEGMEEAILSSLDDLKKEIQGAETADDIDITVALNVSLKGIEPDVDETGNVVVKKLIYEVSPYYTAKVDGKEHEAKKLDNKYIDGIITFRLPVHSSVNERYAKVKHHGIEYYDIQGNEEKYIEVKADRFSTFEVEFTDFKPSEGGGTGSGGGSSTVALKPNGTWHEDNNGWWFSKTDGTYPSDSWYECYWNGEMKWYHFNEDGYADGGWFADNDGNTYYLHNLHDNNFGYMYTGWNWIDGKCYYFTPWRTVGGLPVGALLKNSTTSDGYTVNANGEWTVDGMVQIK